MREKHEDDNGNNTLVVQLDDRLPAINTEKAATAVRVLDGFVDCLLTEFKDELQKKIMHWRVLDFEMIGDVIEGRVYGQIVGASLAIAEKEDQRKVVLT